MANPFHLLVAFALASPAIAAPYPRAQELLTAALSLSSTEAEAHLLASSTRNPSKDQDVETILACTPLSAARTARTKAFSSLITPLYTSKKTGVYCFTAHSSAATVREETPENLVVTPLPMAAKFANSLFDNAEGEPRRVHSRFRHPTRRAIDDAGIIIDDDDDEKDEIPALDSLTLIFARGAHPSTRAHAIEWVRSIAASVASSGGDGSAASCDFAALALASRKRQWPVAKAEDPNHRFKEEAFLLHGVQSLDSGVDEVKKEGCLLSLLEALSAQPSIVHIAPHQTRVAALNSRITKLIQSEENTRSLSSRATPLWDLGLDGSGQILGAVSIRRFHDVLSQHSF